MTNPPDRKDWLLFAALTAMWGSAYVFIDLGLRGFPPEAVVTGRLVLASALLIGLMLANGQRWPGLSQWRLWLMMTAMGAFGSVLPFLAISYAQQSVSSGLAALFLATTPIFIAGGAHALYRDERLTWMGGLGVLVGFIGMAVLAGPEAISEVLEGRLTAQALLVLAALFYAISTLIAKASPARIEPLAFAAGFVSIAAVMSLPFLAIADWSESSPAVVPVLAIIALAVFPSALAQVGYVSLVRRTSANFLALTNYTIPVFAALLGWLALGDQLSLRAWLAFAIILAGVWLARQGKAIRRKTAPQSQ